MSSITCRRVTWDMWCRYLSPHLHFMPHIHTNRSTKNTHKIMQINAIQVIHLSSFYSSDRFELATTKYCLCGVVKKQLSRNHSNISLFFKFSSTQPGGLIKNRSWSLLFCYLPSLHFSSSSSTPAVEYFTAAVIRLSCPACSPTVFCTNVIHQIGLGLTALTSTK